MGTREMNSMVMRELGVYVCVHAMGGGSGIWGKECRGRGQGRLGEGHGSRPLVGRRGSCGAQGYTGVYQRSQVGEVGGGKAFLPV